MALGAKLVLWGLRDKLTAGELAQLVRFNSLPGSARAFARTVRDVIDWRGQRRGFLHRAHEVKHLPPVMLLWGDRDNLIPARQALEFTRLMKGSILRMFEGCGHFLHNEKPEEVADAVRDFFDDPWARETKLVVAKAREGTRAFPLTLLPGVSGSSRGATLRAMDRGLPT
jgi:pimeloyl-ACP methyl ester carboxylesterase